MEKIKNINSTLLIGNGINRIKSDGVSWHQIIEQLFQFIDAEKYLNNSSIKPFTLLYEELAVHCLRKNKLESELKKHVAASMKAMAHNGLHGRIIELGFKHIFTTNYDYCLESSNGISATPSYLREEKRYNLFRRRELSQSNIWHIHGEISRPRSITLGYDHYVGYLSKLKNYLIWERKNKAIDRRYSAFMQGIKNFDDDKKQHSWVDIFLRDNVHILGFGIDYSEIDIWWLLVFKERHKLKSRKCSTISTAGDTIFYNIYTEPVSLIDHGRISMLKSVGVNVVNILCDRGYERAYHDALNRIKEYA